MGFKKPFGGIWDGVGEDLERILGGFGKVLARFWEGLKSFGRIWGRSWKHFLKPFYVRTPALSREAPRSVSMRGGPPPSVVERDLNTCKTF